MSAAPSSPAGGEQRAQVAGALPDVGHRAFAAGFRGENGVLLQDVPAAVVAAAQVADDGGEVDVTATQRPVHAAPYPLGVGQPTRPDLGCDLVVDVLEVGVRDAVRGLPGQLGRVGAADQQVAGVQAERDGRALKHPLDLLAALHHGADVRVQHGTDAARGGQAGEPVEVGEQRLPARLVQVGPGVVAVLAGGGGQHEGPGAGGVVTVEQAVDLRRGVVARLV